MKEKRIIYMTNPQGEMHNWVKQRFDQANIQPWNSGDWAIKGADMSDDAIKSEQESGFDPSDEGTSYAEVQNMIHTRTPEELAEEIVRLRELITEELLSMNENEGVLTRTDDPNVFILHEHWEGKHKDIPVKIDPWK